MLAFVVASAGMALATPVEEAKRVEAEAFLAVESDRWCDALALFQRANTLVPNADLVFNAAQAAEYAGDRAEAVRLYQELLALSSARKGTAQKRLTTLTAKLEKDGPGSKCAPPPLPAPAATTAAAPTPTAPPAAPPSEPAPATTTESAMSATSEASNEPSTAEPGRIEALESELPIEPPARDPGLDLLTVPWMTAGAGGVAAVTGIAMFAIGGAQWLSYVGAVGEVRELERTDPEFNDAFARRQAAADQWEGWGKATTFAGIGVGVAGLVTAGVGGALALSE